MYFVNFCLAQPVYLLNSKWESLIFSFLTCFVWYYMILLLISSFPHFFFFFQYMYVCVFKQFLDFAKTDLFYTRIDHFNKISCNFHETVRNRFC